jgi:hypothetical protein
MTWKNTERVNASAAHHLRRVLVGHSSRNAISATAIGILLVLCVTVVQFSLVQSLFTNASYRWSATGLLSILLWLCLVAIAAVYSLSGGGLIDSCAILLVPLFISHLTIVSVAPTTGGSIPIWQWSFDQYFAQNIRAAIYGALLWGSGLGATGFLFGAVVRATSRIGAD